MAEFSDFYLGKKKDNMVVNLSDIKGGLRESAISKDTFSIFKDVLDTNSDQIIDKDEIDKFIEEIKTYAKDNNFSMSEAAKYLKDKNLKQVKQEELFKLIQNLSQAGENIAESSVIVGENGDKTIFIKYKDSSEETIYPDKTSKVETCGDDNEKIAKSFDEAGNLQSEITIYKDNSTKTVTYTNNQVLSEVIEKEGVITSVDYENGMPKSKSVKTGEAIQNYAYIDGKELPIYSKTFENKVWVEKSYQYDDKAQLVSLEVKKGENDFKRDTYEYHPNGQMSKNTTFTQVQYDNNDLKTKDRVITYSESGKRLMLKDARVTKWNDGESFESTDVIHFDKDGNIVGYVPINSSLKSILNRLGIKAGTELYDKFMELNKKYIKTYNNGKVKGFDVGAKFIIPGELEDKAFDYSKVDPRYEKESYNSKYLGQADVQGIPTGSKTIEKDTTWWELAKQNLIEMGIKNPTQAQIAENLDILITLNSAKWEMNSPVQKGREVIVRIQESANLPDKYKLSSYNLKNLQKTYPANKYQIKKERVNPKTDEWGYEEQGIFAYHVFDKSTGKKILSVIPSTKIWLQELTVKYFNTAGKVTSEILLRQYDEKIEETVYNSDKTIHNTYNKNGTLERTEYTDPKTGRKYRIDNPKSPDKEVTITSDDYFENQKYRNGKLSQRRLNTVYEYYDLNGKYMYSINEKLLEGELQIHYPLTNTLAAKLKASDGAGALNILQQLDNSNYKAFLSAYQTNNNKDLIDSIKESKLDETQKNQLLATIRKLIYNDNKITKTKRTSQISTPQYQGAAYDISLSGNTLSIKNKTTGKTSTIDLNKFLSKCTEFERAVIKKNLVENLPGEVLEDIAIESRFVKVSPDMKVISYNEDIEAAGYYQSRSDSITLSRKEIYNIHIPIFGLDQISSSIPEVYTHELGHAIDYNGYVLNTNSSGANKFKEVFEKELEKYKAAGKVQYSYEKGFKQETTLNNNTGKTDMNTAYATANEEEMFAECYTLMMLGDCQSKEHILKYFPQTFEAAKALLAEIRQKSDIERYNPVHK